MKITFVNATRKWGGVKTWVLDFAAMLSQKGHSVRIYGRQPEFINAARIRVGHGEHMAFGPDLNPLAVMRFMRAFREQGTQVVIGNIGKDLATAGVAARLMGIPFIQQIGLPRDIPYRLKTRLLHQWIAPKYLCSCQYIADGFLASLPYLRKEDIRVVLTAKQTCTTAMQAHSPRRLVVTQQLMADKDHATLLRALAPIQTPYELHVAGTGETEASLKALAQQLGIAHKITWHGFSNNVPGLLHECDIFLLASLLEGLPNTLQEALSEGLVPVIRNVGGVREVCLPQLEQWILPYEASPEAFRAVIEKALALTDDELLAVKETARRSCRTFCDLEQKAREFEAMLEAVIASARP